MGIFSLLPWARRNETTTFLTLVWLSGLPSVLKPMKADVKTQKNMVWQVRTGSEEERRGNKVFYNIKVLV